MKNSIPYELIFKLDKLSLSRIYYLEGNQLSQLFDLENYIIFKNYDLTLIRTKLETSVKLSFGHKNLF